MTMLGRITTVDDIAALLGRSGGRVMTGESAGVSSVTRLPHHVHTALHCSLNTGDVERASRTMCHATNRCRTARKAAIAVRIGHGTSRATAGASATWQVLMTSATGLRRRPQYEQSE